MGSIEIDMDKQQGDIYDIESNLDKPEPDMDEMMQMKQKVNWRTIMWYRNLTERFQNSPLQ